MFCGHERQSNLDKHKGVSKKYLASKILPLEKDGVFSVGPLDKPEKMKI